jgi:hypothetical protein
VQLLEPLSHLFEAKTIDEYSEDDAPANIDTERPHAHCTGAAMVRGRRMKKNSDAKKAIAQNRTFLQDPPPPYPHPLNVAETHCTRHVARRHARGISPAARLVASRLPDVHAGVFVNL